MKITTQPTADPFVPTWPDGFPEEPTATCGACGAEIAFETPRDFTVRHHPPNRDHPDYMPPRKVPETGAYVAADASGTVPIDPEGERFVIEYTCPSCGAIQRTEV